MLILIQLQIQVRSPKLTINNLPDELLVEIFDFYRQNNADSNKWWSIEHGWFKLIHVCKRWRTVMFASSSRLDLCYVLSRDIGGNMKATLLRNFPPLPIDISYDYQSTQAVRVKDMRNIIAALKLPDRIRRITLTGTAGTLDKFFQATNRPFPALESLALCDLYDELKIPTTFLGGSDLHLRSLALDCISLPPISRLLSSAPALTHLSLGIHKDVGRRSATSLLSHLQGMPCLRHLDLNIDEIIVDQAQPNEPKENFPLSKLTHFHYAGHSVFLNALVARLSAPSLRDVHIELLDSMSLPAVHPSRFIKDIGEGYHVVQVVFESRYFRLLARSEHGLPCFRLTSGLFPEETIRIINVFSTKLTTAEELFVTFLFDDEAEEIPYRGFFLQFPSVKALRIEGMNKSRVAEALRQGHEDPLRVFLPALEEIELCMPLEPNPDMNPEDELASEMAAFQPFISARQQVSRPVRVFWGPPLGLSGRYP